MCYKCMYDCQLCSDCMYNDCKQKIDDDNKSDLFNCVTEKITKVKNPDPLSLTVYVLSLVHYV